MDDLLKNKLNHLNNQLNNIEDDIFNEMKNESNKLNENFKEHIILLGDSILDNANYVKFNTISDLCVTEQFQDTIAKKNLEYKVSNLAIDGYTTDDILDNKIINKIPKNATYILLSIGGNDGLMSLNELNNPKMLLPWNFINLLLQTKNKFKIKYNTILKNINKLHPNCKIICMTIYYPIFYHSILLQIISNIGVNIMSNVIINETSKYNIPIIDIRKVFDKWQDYANSIEPGIPGGDKIVNNTLNIIDKYNFNVKHNNKNRIFCNKEYNKWININKYSNIDNAWKHDCNQYQKGGPATQFFRRAFNEDQNTNIKRFIGFVGISMVIGVAFFVHKRYINSKLVKP